MEHIVQFGIGIDDNAIRSRIEKYAYNDVLDKISQETMDAVLRTLTRIRGKTCVRP